ncbi:Hypothetical predicted protein [Lecanosticta acicola]|uniref:Uncharacterized protein n=1 Tax=Lecanosticta acicola TaxID=111012 RepID=A0AAI8Z1U1_9PEZI|nr:Hypothetical predicted protein [Lecanosticta acicola]
MGKMLSSLRSCVSEDETGGEHRFIPARILQHPNSRNNVQTRSPPWLVYTGPPSDSGDTINVLRTLPSPLGALVDPKISAIVQTEAVIIPETVLIPEISLNNTITVNIILPPETEELPLLAAPATPATILF